MFDDILGPYEPKPSFGEEQYPDEDKDIEYKEPRTNVASMTGSIKRGVIQHHDAMPPNKRPWNTGNRPKGVWRT